MIKKFTFKDSDSSKLFISADFHLNHSPKWEIPIWKMRGYNSPEEMTTGIIRQINETCLSTDYLMVIGDFCLNTSDEQFYSLVNRINPKMYFLRGNHNNPWERLYLNHCEKEFGYEVIGYNWLDKIIYLGDYQLFTWNRQQFAATHFPMYVFDYMRHGCIALVGHSHGSCKLSHPNDTTSKMIDCGWDIWKRPVSFKELIDCANKKQIFKADMH